MCILIGKIAILSNFPEKTDAKAQKNTAKRSLILTALTVLYNAVSARKHIAIADFPLYILSFWSPAIYAADEYIKCLCI